MRGSKGVSDFWQFISQQHAKPAKEENPTTTKYHQQHQCGMKTSVKSGKREVRSSFQGCQRYRAYPNTETLYIKQFTASTRQSCWDFDIYL